MNNILILLLLLTVSISGYADEYDAPPSGYPDNECKAVAKSRAIYDIDYVVQNGAYKIVMKDKHGKEASENHLLCVVENQKVMWKAGKNVKKIKLTFFKDSGKQTRGCPDVPSVCKAINGAFKVTHQLKGKKIAVPVIEFYYDITIEPKSGIPCTDPVSGNNNCFLDPKLKIVK